MRLIFRKTVAVLKKFNFKSYHETKHNNFKFDVKMKQLKIKEFQLQLKTQKTIFGSVLQQPSNIGMVNFSVSFLIAKK